MFERIQALITEGKFRSAATALANVVGTEKYNEEDFQQLNKEIKKNFRVVKASKKIGEVIPPKGKNSGTHARWGNGH